MTRRRVVWAIATAATIAAVVVLLWRAGIVCSTPRHRLALDIGKAAGCYEFWLHRYQGLLGSAVAAAVAGATLYHILRQIHANESQATAAMRAAELSNLTFWQASRDRAEKAMHNLRSVEDIALQVDEVLSRRGVDRHFANAAGSLTMTAFGRKTLTDDTTDQVAYRYMEVTEKIRRARQGFDDRWTERHSEFEAQLERMFDELQQLRSELPSAIERRHRDIERADIRIRDLEDLLAKT